MSHRLREFDSKLKKFLSSSNMTDYLEPEQKLDASCSSTLDDVEQFILTHPGFCLLNISDDLPLPDGINIDVGLLKIDGVKPAQQITPQRFRLYYDTPTLTAFHRGVEVRIELPGPTEHGHSKHYKQVVKLGGGASKDDPTFHRLEISGRLKEPVPTFQPDALDGKKDLSNFLHKTFKASAFRPLQLLTTVRTRIWCRPKNEADTIIEFGIDRGWGMTVTGFRYPILQIEPELIKGRQGALDDVSQTLRNHFGNALSVNLTSKPTPGYMNLAPILRTNKAAKTCTRALPVREFGQISLETCPSLFLA